MIKSPLSAIEARVIGSLLEKQVTTPDQYPLSLNGVVTACNQKSNREPVMSLTDSEVQNTLDLLVKKHQLTAINGFGSRVVKYEQRFCNSEFGQLKFSPAELALVATLLLRGAQTPGELRTRSTRLYDFSDVGEVEQVLEGLSQRESGALVMRLAREPGKRESRYMHLFSGEPEAGSLPSSHGDPADDEVLARVAQLERDVAQLKQQLEALLECQDHR